MELTFNTKGYIHKINFKPETAARLFRKVWDWAENFDRKIANDSNIKIETISINKEDNNPFAKNLIIRIQGTAYGLPIDEKVSFSINSVLYAKKPNKSFGEYLTERLVERFKEIEVTLNKQSFSIGKTLTAIAV